MRPLRPLALLTTALALAACGGDDGADADEAAITQAIEGAVTGTDPAECTELQTQSFVEQTQFSEGDEALRQCEDDAGETTADSVEVSAIEVEGTSATADAALTGGGFNGQTLLISLVKEGENWKLDRIEDFVEFDAVTFADAVASEASADGETSQELIDCVKQAVTEGDPEAIQSAYLSGEESELLSVFGPCFGGE